MKKCVYFHILHTCVKSHQPIDNKTKAMTNISTLIGYPEKFKKLAFKF